MKKINHTYFQQFTTLPIFITITSYSALGQVDENLTRKFYRFLEVLLVIRKEVENATYF